MTAFHPVSEPIVREVLNKTTIKTCELDPLPSSLLDPLTDDLLPPFTFDSSSMLFYVHGSEMAY